MEWLRLHQRWCTLARAATRRRWHGAALRPQPNLRALKHMFHQVEVDCHQSALLVNDAGRDEARVHLLLQRTESTRRYGTQQTNGDSQAGLRAEGCASHPSPLQMCAERRCAASKRLLAFKKVLPNKRAVVFVPKTYGATGPRHEAHGAMAPTVLFRLI